MRIKEQLMIKYENIPLTFNQKIYKIWDQLIPIFYLFGISLAITLVIMGGF